MEEDHDELRYVCKMCDRRFPSGKSLGGHMRSHVIAANLVESDDEFEQLNKHSALIINGNDSNSYGLRKNPKKSLRASSSSSPNEKICRQCGKGFQSLKALCGHMAFHSEKDKGLKDYDYSWRSLEDHSDTEDEEFELQDPVCVTRSKSKRYKKGVIVIKPSSLSLTNTNSSSSTLYNYGSSSVSETDEFELEDVAMCLMMLSKDSTNWGGVNSVELKNSRKEWNLGKNDSKSFPFANTNSGYCGNGIRKLESGNSVERVVGNRSKGVSYRDLSYEEKQEIRRNLFSEFGYDDSLKKIVKDDDSYKKRSKYECMNCNKTFSSFQGLGGHRPCHKKNNAYSTYENGSEREYACDQTAKYEKKARLKKNKGHECPICFRMFKSGQALGGHKRSHFINGYEDRDDHSEAMERAGATHTNMIDLNLPAPEED